MIGGTKFPYKAATGTEFNAMNSVPWNFVRTKVIKYRKRKTSENHKFLVTISAGLSGTLGTPVQLARGGVFQILLKSENYFSIYNISVDY